MRLFLDTSVLAKLYHQEPGSLRTEALVEATQGECFVSRLGVLEMQSAFGMKVRTGALTAADALTVAERFRADLKKQKYQVRSLSKRHFLSAESLLQKCGITPGLRTLDAIQLASALDAQQQRGTLTLLTSDKTLARVAIME